MSQPKPLRMTKQRRVILSELKKTRTHPTADDVYRRVRRRLPHISLGTVYRNLEVLSQCGMILKLELAGTPRRYDGITENHSHARCMECGAVVDLCLDSQVVMDPGVFAPNGYEILFKKIEFVGICPKCRTSKEEARRHSSDESFAGRTGKGRP